MSVVARYLSELATSGAVVVRVAMIIRRGGRLLAQQAADDPTGFYAFPGGRYEPGDAFETRAGQELAEETDARLVSARYGFVVENRFAHEGRLIHLLEHYLFVEIDRDAVTSREAHLTFHWLPLQGIETRDLRPTVVRDRLNAPDLDAIRHLEGPGFAG